VAAVVAVATAEVDVAAVVATVIGARSPVIWLATVRNRTHVDKAQVVKLAVTMKTIRIKKATSTTKANYISRYSHKNINIEHSSGSLAHFFPISLSKTCVPSKRNIFSFFSFIPFFSFFSRSSFLCSSSSTLLKRF